VHLSLIQFPIVSNMLATRRSTTSTHNLPPSYYGLVPRFATYVFQTLNHHPASTRYVSRHAGSDVSANHIQQRSGTLSGFRLLQGRMSTQVIASFSEVRKYWGGHFFAVGWCNPRTRKQFSLSLNCPQSSPPHESIPVHSDLKSSNPPVHLHAGRNYRPYQRQSTTT
jgi:hypothetical protein